MGTYSTVVYNQEYIFDYFDDDLDTSMIGPHGITLYPDIDEFFRTNNITLDRLPLRESDDAYLKWKINWVNDDQKIEFKLRFG